MWSNSVQRLRWVKVSAILPDIFRMHFLDRLVAYFGSNSTEVGSLGFNWHLVQVMAWRLRGDKPLPWPMITQLTDTHISSGLNVLKEASYIVPGWLSAVLEVCSTAEKCIELTISSVWLITSVISDAEESGMRWWTALSPQHTSCSIHHLGNSCGSALPVLTDKKLSTPCGTPTVYPQLNLHLVLIITAIFSCLYYLPNGHMTQK